MFLDLGFWMILSELGLEKCKPSQTLLASAKPTPISFPFSPANFRGQILIGGASSSMGQSD